MLKIEKTVQDKKATLYLAGRLDLLTASEMEAAFREVVSDVDELILDLTSLEYVSSAGLRVLLFAQKALSVRGKLTVRNPNETVSEIFRLTGFSDILNIE